ncbi:MAG: energy-coupling factor transporter transmembrane component T [Candidatus Bathyarchaeia archaeon]|jgi:energy-coupling factor transport system permease protein
MASPLTFWSLDKKTFLHALDPRVKILLIASIMYIAFVLVNDIRVYVALHIFAIILIVLARVPKITRWYMAGFCFSTILGLTVLGTFGLRTGGGPPNTVLLGTIFGLPVYLEGVLWGLVISFKTTLAFLISVVLVSTTDPSEMLLSLSKIGLPSVLAFGVTVTVRLVPLFLEEYINISNAIDLRGHKSGRFARNLYKMKLILEPLMIGALRRSTEMGNAIQIKAFGTTKRTAFRDLSMKRTDWIIVGAILVTAAALTYLRFSYGFLAGVGFTYHTPS